MSSLGIDYFDKNDLLHYHQKVRKIIAEKTRIQLPSITGNGNVSVYDSAYGYLLDVVIEGNSVQDTVPTLSAPVTITSVADNKDISISNYTNRFNVNNPKYVTGLTCNDTNNNFEESSVSTNRLYYVSCRPDTTYTFSKSVGTYCRLASCENIPTLNADITTMNEDISSSICEITTGAFDNYLVFEPLSIEEIDSIGYDVVEPSVEIKTIISISIGLDEPLRSCGDVHDSIRLLDDSYGIYRRIQDYEYSGATTEGWTATSVTGQYKVAIPGGKSFALPMCTHAIGKETETTEVDECYYNNGEFIINTSYSTLNEFLTALTTSKMTVFIVSAQPSFTIMDEEEQLKLFSLTSYDGNTTLSVSDALSPKISFTYPNTDVSGMISKISNFLISVGSKSSADRITFNGIDSGLEAENVQGAIDEIIRKHGNGSVELTQAEYDALPVSKYSDNITYYITDSDESEVAGDVVYDGSISGIEETNVQDALDFVIGKVTDIENRAVYHTTPEGVVLMG